MINFISNAPVCFSIMVIILIVSVISITRTSFFLKLILHPYSIKKDRQFYRVITADLVHNDILHLALNEFMLVTFGVHLENYLRLKTDHGSIRFLFIYLISNLSGAAAATVRHSNDFEFSSAGASGSIMGCMFSYIILQPNVTAYYLPGIGAVSNLYGGLLFIIALIFYQRRTGNNLASHEVHFFGALGGLLATFILVPVLI